ncbi:MAG TPA: hypothetical protein VGX24_07350 [Pyrinomonadaceae bacterium]|jgi:hypothetical protein|nr:hypothetical protein [Pyrinomonadaceae bacterium]
MQKAQHRRPTSRDVEPLEFERLSSRAAHLSRGWNLWLPTSVRLRLELLPAYNRTISPQLIEQESRNTLVRLCELGGIHAVVDLTPHQERKRQLKGFIAYASGVCDLASLALSNSCKKSRENVNIESWVKLKDPAKVKDQGSSVEEELQSVFDRLSVLRKIEDAGDEYTFRLTPYAYKEAKLTIMETAERMGEKFPMPYIVPDGEGGLVANWALEGREVRLRFQASSEYRSYIYYETADDYDVDPVSVENLIKRLEWLNNA